MWIAVLMNEKLFIDAAQRTPGDTQACVDVFLVPLVESLEKSLD